MSTGRPVATVAVWRSWWLPPSETFIRDHVRSLSRWSPLLLGLGHRDGSLGAVPDVAPFPDNRFGYRVEQVAHRIAYRGIYDRRIRRTRPALMHVHFGTDATRVLPLVSRLELPFVVTFHGYDVLRAPGLDRTGRYRERLRQVFERAAALLPVSEFVAERLLELGAPAAKVRTHALGTVVTHPLAAVDAPRLGITYVGRLVEYKGVDDLIAAVSRLAPELRRATPVTIIGDGPERGRLERSAAAVDSADITFLGHRPPDEVAARLRRSAVFAAAPRTTADGSAEAYGMVYLEAALAGTPAVAYDSGGVASAVLHGRTGLLAREGDVAGLSAHLTELLTDGARARALGAAGQARVSRELDVRRRTAVLEDLYDHVAAGRADVPHDTVLEGWKT